MKPITEEFASLTNPSDHQRGVPSLRLAPVPRRAVVLAGAVLLVTTVASVTTSLLGQRVYGGRADIVVSTAGFESESAATRRLTTEKVIVESERVLGRVATTERIPLKKVRKALSVSIVGQTAILRITVRDSNRSRARRLAEAVADSYVRSTVSPAPGGGPSATLVAPAHLLDHPLRPRPVQAGAGGLLAGVFLAGAVLVVSWARSRRPWDAWM